MIEHANIILPVCVLPLVERQALLDAAVCSADTWTVMVARLGLRPVDQQEAI